MLRSSPTRFPGNPIRAILGFTLFLWMLPLSAQGDETRVDRRQQARDAEKRGAWLEACRCYDELLRKDRNNVAFREAYQRCLRRLHVVARHNDLLYPMILKKLTASQALDAYEQVLALLAAAYPDRAKTNLTLLFQQGLQELQLALEVPIFRRQYLEGVKPGALKAFKERLAAWPVRKITRRSEARDQVRAVLAVAPKAGIALKPLIASAFALEFAAGACNALDEYSSFLTPGNLLLAQSALHGKMVGVGMEIGLVDEKLLITRVYHKGPAFEAGLSKNDRILRIAGQPVEKLPVETAAERLRGAPGSSVEVEVIEGNMTKRFRLVRRAVLVPSVEYDTLLLPESITIGYLRISYFADSTLQEVREVIAGLTPSTKGIILDLRGNPGGLFKAAVSVAELFLTDGIIVIGQSPFTEYNRSFKVETSGPMQAQLPLVVLIDGETASAAEVLAGALKECRPGNIPTVVIGQTSYGKGSIQCVIPMEKTAFLRSPGIRLTVAKLFSPSNQPYTGRGVVPHEVSTLEGDALLLEARKKLLDLITPKPPEMLPPRPPMTIVRSPSPTMS